jgi:hypothetical protein
MGQIYSRAGRVVVWLGYPEDKSARRIKEVFDGLHEDFGDDTSIDEDYWCTKDRSPPWDILEMFTNNVWFTRIWCVQEVRSASARVLYWGEQEISWHIITELGRWLYRKGLYGFPDAFDIRNVVVFIIHRSLAAGECRLLEALDTFQTWDATNPRDKVYGIIGLAELDEERHLITVDYNRSVAEVYRDAAIAVLKQTGDLTIFSYVGF